MSEDRPVGKAPAARTTSSEDWYVGVGGVPLGPVRLAVIREKALAGAVDGDSLVWREGFDEWLPLKNFPELLEIVTQAQSTRLSTPGRRISTSFSAVQPPAAPAPKVPPPVRVPPPGAAVPARSPLREPEPPGVNERPPSPAAPVARFTAGAPAASPPLPTSMARVPPVTPVAANAPASGPISASAPVAANAPASAPISANAPVAASALIPGGAPASESAPAAWPGAPASAARSQAASAAPVEVLADPFAPGPVAPVAPARGASAPAGGLPSAEPAPLVATPASLVETVSPRRRSGMSPLAYAFIAMAAAFGGVSAFVLLSPKQPPPVQIVTAPPAQADLLPTAAPPPPPPPSAAPEAPLPAETAPAKPEVSSPGKPGGAATQRPSPEKPVASGGAAPAPIDRSGFGAGVPGPSSGPGSQGAGAGLSQLSQGEISGVVESNRPGVRRHCWQPALDARASNAASTARVSASVVIGPSGAVQSVSAGGSEKDYPGLASCIASRIKSWRFPPSSGTTPVSIPFVFAAQ